MLLANLQSVSRQLRDGVPEERHHQRRRQPVEPDPNQAGGRARGTGTEARILHIE